MNPTGWPRSDGAGNLQQQPLPARDGLIADPENAGTRAAPTAHPWSEPGADLVRQMSDRIALRQVNPHRLVCPRRVGDEEQLLEGTNPGQMTGASREGQTMHSSAEYGGGLRRQRGGDSGELYGFLPAWMVAAVARDRSKL